jgi:hypothetical protein
MLKHNRSYNTVKEWRERKLVDGDCYFLPRIESPDVVGVEREEAG